MLDIMADMDQKDNFMRGFWWLRDVVWCESLSLLVLTILHWDSVMPMKGKYIINYIQYPRR